MLNISNTITTLNTKEIFTNDLILCRRTHETSFFDTSLNKLERITAFGKIIEIIENGNTPIFINELFNINWLKIEYEVEKIRNFYFSDYPSRLSCTFSSQEFKEFSTPLHTVKIEESCKVIKCDMQIINFLRTYPSYLMMVNILEGYWEGKTLRECINNPNALPPVWEFLIEGKHHIQPKI